MKTPQLLTGILLAASTAGAWAYQPLITDDTGTQGQGGNQLEFSYERDRAKQAGFTDTTRILNTTFTRGLTDTLDAFVSVSHVRISSELPGIAVASGSGNPALGMKWRFYENEESKTSFAIKPVLRFSLDDNKEASGLGSGRTSYGITGILTQETWFGAVHANLVADRTRNSNTAANPNATLYRASVAPVWDFQEHWKAVCDIGVEAERAAGDTTHAYFFELGTIYSPNKDLDFAFALVHYNQRSHPSTSTNILTAGVTWRFR
ncbi:MAG: hypothetical protein HY847_06330 [Betaproteobacteria bacterium]|nr:hypothetical protein [Betaproteobacteria bacterium]